MGTLLGLQNGLARSVLLADLLRPRLREEEDEEEDEKEECDDAENDDEEEEEDAVRLNKVVRPMRGLRCPGDDRRGVTLPSVGITMGSKMVASWAVIGDL